MLILSHVTLVNWNYSVQSPLYEFIEKSKHCSNFDELCVLVQGTLSGLGFERWGYESDPVNLFEDTAPVFVHTFPEEWVNHYMEQQFYKLDPVIIKGKSLHTPFQWSHLTLGEEVGKSLAEYNNQASEFGLNEGIGVPIPRADGKKSIFTITGNKNSKEIDRLIKERHEQLISIACAFHSIASDFLRDKRTDEFKNPLTGREQECVLWTAKGKTSWEISQIINVSERTVNFHLNNAREKVGASNKYQMVVNCIMNMYIRP